MSHRPAFGYLRLSVVVFWVGRYGQPTFGSLSFLNCAGRRHVDHCLALMNGLPIHLGRPLLAKMSQGRFRKVGLSIGERESCD